MYQSPSIPNPDMDPFRVYNIILIFHNVICVERSMRSFTVSDHENYIFFQSPVTSHSYTNLLKVYTHTVNIFIYVLIYINIFINTLL